MQCGGIAGKPVVTSEENWNRFAAVAKYEYVPRAFSGILLVVNEAQFYLSKFIEITSHLRF